MGHFSESKLRLFFCGTFFQKVTHTQTHTHTHRQLKIANVNVSIHEGTNHVFEKPTLKNFREANISVFISCGEQLYKSCFPSLCVCVSVCVCLSVCALHFFVGHFFRK